MNKPINIKPRAFIFNSIVFKDSICPISITSKLLAILFMFAASGGCDIIDPPYLQNSVTPEDTTKNIRKVLIEDYTGYLCKNCPEAAVIAEDLKELYGSRIIVLGVHSGWFAEPNPSTDYDFRTTEGDELDQFFGISNVGNPNGMVSRKLNEGNRVIAPGNWESVFLGIKDDSPVLYITMSADYSSSNKIIGIDVKLNYKKDASANNYLAIYIAEDSIVGKQLVKGHNPELVTDYVHNNVLRGSVSGTWGEQLSDAAIIAGSEINKHYDYKIPDGKDWRPEKLKLLAFVHENNTTFEILQAEEIYLFEQNPNPLLFLKPAPMH